MSRTSKAATRALAAGALLAATTVATVAAAPPASAYCSPYNSAYHAEYYVTWGVEIGHGEPDTCDGDYYYRGHLADTWRDDGSCVRVEYADHDFFAVLATSCDAAGIDYTYIDSIGNNAAYMRVCKNGSGCAPWVATFGY
jgi:hypothetical protein